MRRLFLTLATLLLTLSLAAQSLPTLRVLAIGNSFSEDAVEQYLYELGREAGQNLIIGNAYRGGQGLESHWNVVKKGEAAFEYRKVVGGKLTNKKGVVLDSILTDEPWDIITLQQVSQDAGLYHTYSPYLSQLIQYIRPRVTNKNVKYGFHQTWAYSHDAAHQGFANYSNDQQIMYASIVDALQRVMNDNNVLSFYVPSGTAIQNMRTTPLGDHMNRDGYHLDKVVGRYTAACTWVEALTGKSPVGMKYRPANVRPAVASIAQQAAHDAILHPFTVTEQKASFQYVDTCRISVFGSSVAHGTGAKDDQGYAYLYGQQLRQRTQSGASKHPFTISNISVGGNKTSDLLRRYNDLVFDLGRYVVFGLSLGNEGIHGSKNQQAVFERWRDNMLRLIDMARADGKVPVVMNNYGRADFNLKDYSYVRRINLLIHEWDLPSINVLGAVDDGQGHWPAGYEADTGHPNTLGHREMMYTIPPSLFDALAAGKPLPVRNGSGDITLSRGNTLKFTPEGTVHSFSLSLVVRGSDHGRICTLQGNGRHAWIGVNKDHHIYYRSSAGDSIVCPIPLEDKARHTVTLSHRYAQRQTLFFVDADQQVASERMQLTSVMIGDRNGRRTKRHFSEVFFWRSALNADEVMALARGAMLKSSLEVYAALNDEEKLQPRNLAQSLTRLYFVKKK